MLKCKIEKESKSKEAGLAGNQKIQTTNTSKTYKCKYEEKKYKFVKTED